MDKIVDIYSNYIIDLNEAECKYYAGYLRKHKAKIGGFLDAKFKVVQQTLNGQ
jgi:hypothetical protein